MALFGGTGASSPHMPTLTGAVVLAIIVVLAYHFIAHHK